MTDEFCGCRIMAITSASQAEYGGSIPLTRSKPRSDFKIISIDTVDDTVDRPVNNTHLFYLRDM